MKNILSIIINFFQIFLKNKKFEILYFRIQLVTFNCLFKKLKMIYKNKNYIPIKPDNKILRTIPETKIIQRPLPNNKKIRAISNNLKQLPLFKKI